MAFGSRTFQIARPHCQPMRLSLPIAMASLLATCGVASAATLCVNPGGTAGCKSSINAAVAAAAPGDTVQVWPGTYYEGVVITKPLSLVALDQTAAAKPVINASGFPNGIFINGMSGAPNAGIANVLIAGLAIRSANFEGILVANASGVNIVDNHVYHNDRALDITAQMCPGIPAFETSEGDDCGEGIHLMSVINSTVVRNDVEGNSGGILISDETGPNRYNLVSKNTVHDNAYDCGITMASHGPATSVLPSATVSFGVANNTIANNFSWHNGTQVPGAGAGVGIFAPFPGTIAHANVVINNTLYDNGLPGVTMHNHAYSPFAPPVDLSDNVIVGNTIYGNAADTDDAATPGTTGINVYSVAPIFGTIISQNIFTDEAIDIAYNAPGDRVDVHQNNFNTTGIGIDNLGVGSVNAADNWWSCAGGPGAAGCATVTGPHITITPWLTAPF